MTESRRIYTRFGDDGTTGLLAGSRVTKDHPRIEAVGAVDELNSLLGLVRTGMLQESLPELTEQLGIIQNAIFDLGSEIAARKSEAGAPAEKSAIVRKLENWSDELNSRLPALTSFILPGGSFLNAHLHMARSVCRRAERAVVSLSHSEPVPAGAIPFLNRLSDYLFLLARYDTQRTGAKEFIWVKGEKS